MIKKVVHESLPWQLSMKVIHESCPWHSSMKVIHDSPWQPDRDCQPFSACLAYPHPRRLLLSCYHNWYMGNIFVYYSFVFVHYNQVQNIFYLINHLYFEFKVLFNIFSECFDFFWYIFSGVHSIDNNWNWILLMCVYFFRPQISAIGAIK